MGILGARISEGLVKYYDEAGGIDDLETNIVSLAVVLGMSFVPFVDWPAHLGGAVAGFVVGSIRFANSTLFGRYGCKVRVERGFRCEGGTFVMFSGTCYKLIR